jgi:hypothetical protein
MEDSNLKNLLAITFLALLIAPNLLHAELSKDPTVTSSSQGIGVEAAEAKDPIMAEVFSVLPGMLIHGSGNYYAGDYKFGTKMLTMELFGAGLAMWGYDVIHQPENWGPYFGSNSQQAGYWIKAAGVAMMSISWIGDVATAGEAADSWNKDHALELQMDSFNGTGARLSLLAKF